MSKIETITRIKEELEKVTAFFQQELNKLHASRVTPSLIDDLKISIAGQEMSLKQLASINISGSNQLIVQPWSDDYLQPIEQAIRQSNMGLNLSVDQKLLRVTTPDLSQERRENLIVLINDKTNQSKDTVRHWWHEGWDEIQKAFSNSLISEDDKFKMKDDLQKLINEYNDRLERMKEDKQEEIKG
jgi:ribosome recycling factor